MGVEDQDYHAHDAGEDDDPVGRALKGGRGGGGRGGRSGRSKGGKYRGGGGGAGGLIGLYVMAGIFGIFLIGLAIFCCLQNANTIRRCCCGCCEPEYVPEIVPAATATNDNQNAQKRGNQKPSEIVYVDVLPPPEVQHETPHIIYVPKDPKNPYGKSEAADANQIDAKLVKMQAKEQPQDELIEEQVQNT